MNILFYVVVIFRDIVMLNISFLTQHSICIVNIIHPQWNSAAYAILLTHTIINFVWYDHIFFKWVTNNNILHCWINEQRNKLYCYLTQSIDIIDNISDPSWPQMHPSNIYRILIWDKIIYLVPSNKCNQSISIHFIYCLSIIITTNINTKPHLFIINKMLLVWEM